VYSFTLLVTLPRVPVAGLVSVVFASWDAILSDAADRRELVVTGRLSASPFGEDDQKYGDVDSRIYYLC